MAFQAGDCSKMGVMLAKTPAPMVFAAGQVQRMRGEWTRRGAGEARYCIGGGGGEAAE